VDDCLLYRVIDSLEDVYTYYSKTLTLLQIAIGYNAGKWDWTLISVLATLYNVNYIINIPIKLLTDLILI